MGTTIKTPTREIRITLDGSGMGDDATYADAQAFHYFVERRLGEMYPEHDITVTLAAEGSAVSKTVALDETIHQDVDDAMARLWDEFCGDTTLWPSTQAETTAISS